MIFLNIKVSLSNLHSSHLNFKFNVSQTDCINSTCELPDWIIVVSSGDHK